MSVGDIGDVEISTKPLMSLPEGSDGIEEGIYMYWHFYSLDFISFFIICLYAYMLICFIPSLYYSSLSTSTISGDA